jgi:hypothetical protein
MTKPKRVAIVSGHFPPSNSVGVHRARLLAQYLPEFGWEPTVVTVHWNDIEENIDSALLELVSPELRVIRTRSFPLKPVRIVGDIGARAFYWHLMTLEQLIIRKEIDFVLITIPSNYSALLGQMLYRRHRFPFGIDYQDPWVHVWPGAEKLLSKAWFSCKLAHWLEPWAVKNAALITGIAPLYFEAVLQRNPSLRNHCVTIAMPMGHSEGDHQMLKASSRKTFLFCKGDGLFHMIYAGALLPKADAVLKRFFEALALLRDSDRALMERVRVHFVGTGTSPNDAQGHNVSLQIQRFGLGRWVDEHPSRINYIDVLNHLDAASAVLIIGSTEAHYSPSKIYQAVQAKSPIFALLHERSSAVNVLRESRAGQAVTFTEKRLPDAHQLSTQLADFVRDPRYSVNDVRWDAFDAYSSRNSARMLADALDRALELFAKRNV